MLLFSIILQYSYVYFFFTVPVLAAAPDIATVYFLYRYLNNNLPFPYTVQFPKIIFTKIFIKLVINISYEQLPSTHSYNTSLFQRLWFCVFFMRNPYSLLVVCYITFIVLNVLSSLQLQTISSLFSHEYSL